MEEENKYRKPQAVYAPGELDRVRKNLGDIEPAEAQRISKLLGGEIGLEKSVEVADKNVEKITSKNSYKKTIFTDFKYESGDEAGGTAINKPISISQLPHLSAKERIAMDKLLSSKKYKIKSGYNFLSMIFGFTEANEKVSAEFLQHNLNDYVGHIQKMVSSVRKIILSAPTEFLQQVELAQEPLYKVFNVFNSWDIMPLNLLLQQYQKNLREVTVVKMIPFIRELFTPLLKVYFLGEKQVATYFKNAYQEMSKSLVPQTKESVLQLTKEAISQWYYIYEQVISGAYPLLMRMCSTECLSMRDFFTKKVSRIFSFLSLTKYDIITADIRIPVQNKIDESAKTEEPIKEKENLREKIPESVKKGLALLDRLFPEVGWLSLDISPDLFPYYQPIMLFRDGFNLLSPDNPLQVTVVLMRIIEELFYGCRAIYFNFGDECGVTAKEDTIADIFNEWPFYREDAFEKKYVSLLKEYVNQAFAQSDFRKTPYARKMLSNIMWIAKSYFLPNLDFEMLILDRPRNDFELKSFPLRVQFLKKILLHLVQGIESSINKSGGRIGGVVNGINNPWSSYVFAVPNVVSRRMDAVLGGKASQNRTNANLLYQTLLIVNVLDWWVNNPDSFAYSKTSLYPYRTKDDENCSPVFSVPTRTDLNEVFIKSLKRHRTEKTGDLSPAVTVLPPENVSKEDNVS